MGWLYLKSLGNQEAEVSLEQSSTSGDSVAWMEGLVLLTTAKSGLKSGVIEFRKFIANYLERSQFGLKMGIKLIYYQLQSLFLSSFSQDVYNEAGKITSAISHLPPGFQGCSTCMNLVSLLTF